MRPLGLAFFGPFWMLASWCELRRDFRTFRIERIGTLEVTADLFRDEPGKMMEDFIARPQERIENATFAGKQVEKKKGRSG